MGRVSSNNESQFDGSVGDQRGLALDLIGNKSEVSTYSGLDWK